MKHKLQILNSTFEVLGNWWSLCLSFNKITLEEKPGWKDIWRVVQNLGLEPEMGFVFDHVSETKELGMSPNNTTPMESRPICIYTCQGFPKSAERRAGPGGACGGSALTPSHPTSAHWGLFWPRRILNETLELKTQKHL